MIKKVIHKFGLFGEKIALEYLKGKGYLVVDKNFYTKYGEVDIIAKDKNILVFLEVKSRKNSKFDLGFVAVDSRKQIKIKKCAELYLQKNNFLGLCRFDVLSIDYKNGNPVFTHIENAFY